MQSFDELLEREGPFSYGCVMLEFLSYEMESINESISAADLHENGIEKDHHVTLLYGLHDDLIDDHVLGVCCGYSYPMIELHNASLFKNEKYDVLKFDVNSEFLHEINKRLSSFPHTTDYPDYHPHATIAYLKPGKGDKYVNELKDKTVWASPHMIVYSKASGEKTQIPINDFKDGKFTLSSTFSGNLSR